jgi:hypothetical protein
MKTSDSVKCTDFPCKDIACASYLVPDVDVDPTLVTILLISEASPKNPADHYYAGENALFARTTVLAFQDAGIKVASIQDILAMGVYLTTAVKCGKTGYGIATQTIQNCSLLLEQEIDLFPNVKVYLLDGCRCDQSAKRYCQKERGSAGDPRRSHVQDTRRRILFPG